jgi:hypothetical protein
VLAGDGSTNEAGLAPKTLEADADGVAAGEDMMLAVYLSGRVKRMCGVGRNRCCEGEECVVVWCRKKEVKEERLENLERFRNI